MKRLVAGILAIVVVTLSACGGNDEPIEVVTPSPWGTPAPTATGTPSQAELSALAEETYRSAFEEWKRLEREGGTDDPTPGLEEHAAGSYLTNIMAALQYQKQQQFTIEGPMPTTSVTPAPGEAQDGSDPRLTLAVCEDNSASVARLPGQEVRGQFVQGWVYLGEVADRLKVISSSTEEVEQCAF